MNSDKLKVKHCIHCGSNRIEWIPIADEYGIIFAGHAENGKEENRNERR